MNTLQRVMADMRRGGDGVFVPSVGIVGGVLESWVNGADYDVAPNTFTIEGIQYILNAALKSAAQVGSFNFAPFSGNVTPASSLTAATFTASVTEFTQYDEASRVVWPSDAPANGVISNTTLAAITISTGVSELTLYGAGLLSSPVKSGTTGTLLAAARFASPKSNLSAGDVVNLRYTLTLTPA